MKEFERSPQYSTGFLQQFFRVSDARSESLETFLLSVSLETSFIGGDRYFHSIADVCGYECV